MTNYQDPKKKIFSDGLRITIMVRLCVRTQTHSKAQTAHIPLIARQEKRRGRENRRFHKCQLSFKEERTKMADTFVIPMLS